MSKETKEVTEAETGIALPAGIGQFSREEINETQGFSRFLDSFHRLVASANVLKLLHKSDKDANGKNIELAEFKSTIKGVIVLHHNWVYRLWKGELENNTDDFDKWPDDQKRIVAVSDQGSGARGNP